MGAAEDACKKAFYDQCTNGKVTNEGMLMLKAIVEPDKTAKPEPIRKEIDKWAASTDPKKKRTKRSDG